jgi:hypothetical protein
VLPVGAGAAVIGFGATKEGGVNSDLLLITNVTISPVGPCNATYSGILGDAQICAGGCGRRRLCWFRSGVELERGLLCVGGCIQPLCYPVTQNHRTQACPAAARTRARATLAGR